MRPERLRSLIKTALAEGATTIKVRLKTGEEVEVVFGPRDDGPDLVEWNK